MLFKGSRLLVMEVKGRSARDRDRGGIDAFDVFKRRRLACAISCWRAEHPEHAHRMLRGCLLWTSLIGAWFRSVGLRWITLAEELGKGLKHK